MSKAIVNKIVIRPKSSGEWRKLSEWFIAVKLASLPVGMSPKDKRAAVDRAAFKSDDFEWLNRDCRHEWSEAIHSAFRQPHVADTGFRLSMRPTPFWIDVVCAWGACHDRRRKHNYILKGGCIGCGSYHERLQRLLADPMFMALLHQSRDVGDGRVMADWLEEQGECDLALKFRETAVSEKRREKRLKKEAEIKIIAKTLMDKVKI